MPRLLEGMGELLDMYSQYYRLRNEQSLEYLLEHIFYHDFSEYEQEIRRIQEARASFVGRYDHSRMSTNGSTGTATPYNFGPNAEMCVDRLERKLRMRNHKTISLYSVYFGSSFARPFSIMKIDGAQERQRDFDVVGDWRVRNHMDKLIRFLDDCYERWGPLNISSLPHIWVCLTTCPQFQSWVSESKRKINAFVNSDCEPLFKDLGVYMRDQMVDWRSGINFYTCEKGHIHFFPIFYVDGEKCSNLLNLSSDHCQHDDSVLVGARVLCECGIYRATMKIETHFKNKIVGEDGKPVEFKGICDLMEGWFHSFQIHQDYSEKIRIFYESENSADRDIERIIGFLKAKGLKKVEVKKSIYTQNGRKRHPFWRSERVREESFNRLTRVGKLII